MSKKVIESFSDVHLVKKNKILELMFSNNCFSDEIRFIEYIMFMPYSFIKVIEALLTYNSFY